MPESLGLSAWLHSGTPLFCPYDQHPCCFLTQLHSISASLTTYVCTTPILPEPVGRFQPSLTKRDRSAELIKVAQVQEQQAEGQPRSSLSLGRAAAQPVWADTGQESSPEASVAPCCLCLVAFIGSRSCSAFQWGGGLGRTRRNLWLRGKWSCLICQSPQEGLRIASAFF